ncbi:hypothetical protein BDR05DRAFT_881262 [Suillus weaverae]|nr:hypothetical protein BDR05DRAFT_881262 [Suillus weaverae]
MSDRNEDEHLAQELTDLSREAEVDEHDDVPLDEEAGIDNVEGLVDKMALLTEGECNKLLCSIRPVKLVLVKLCKLSNKVIHLIMKLLPAWHNILEEQHLPVTNIPQDVTTQWNSTFDMLKYVSIHQMAVDTMTQCKDLQDLS